MDEKLWLFSETDELNDDASNWWAPTTAGLVAAGHAAGFRQVAIIAEPVEHTPPNPGYTLHYGRAIVHART